jgi:hypothetical protein
MGASLNKVVTVSFEQGLTEGGSTRACRLSGKFSNKILKT